MSGYGIALGALGLLEGVAMMGGVLLFRRIVMRDRKGGATQLKQEFERRKELKERVFSVYDTMVRVPDVRARGNELKGVIEALKAERGRITITQAELETVETRLRELEEIERELEASSLETQEELKILRKKEGELGKKNETLKGELGGIGKEIGRLASELQLNEERTEQVQKMNAELAQSQEKINNLLEQITEGNQQYFTLKRRYDALDIEYAQLYERFLESEESR